VGRVLAEVDLDPSDWLVIQVALEAHEATMRRQGAYEAAHAARRALDKLGGSPCR
jgi:hypothetical protein